MVPGLRADVLEAESAAPGEHEHPAELPHVALGLALARAAAVGANAVLEHSGMERPHDAAVKSRGPVSHEILVDEKGEVDPLFFTEGPRLPRSPVTDHDELCSGGTDVVQLATQLRDLLSAKQSAEVADEDEYDWLFRPGVA